MSAVSLFSIKVILAIMLIFGIVACSGKEDAPAQEVSQEQQAKIKKTISKISSAFLPDDVEVEMVKLMDALGKHDVQYVLENSTEEFLAVKDVESKLSRYFEDFVIMGEPLETTLLDANVGKKWTLRTGATTIYKAKYERIFETEKNVFTITMFRTKKHACCQLQYLNMRLHKLSAGQDVGEEKSETPSSVVEETEQ